jgi:hypothetical protein
MPERAKKPLSPYEEKDFHVPGAGEGTDPVRIRHITLSASPPSKMQMVRLSIHHCVERGDPTFWEPRWHEEAYQYLSPGKSRFPVHPLGEFLKEGTEGLTYGSTATGEDREIYDQLPNDGRTYVRYIKSKHILRTGLDVSRLSWTPEDKRLADRQYEVLPGDIVMNKSGVGSAGRIALVPENLSSPCVVSQHTMRIRLLSANEMEGKTMLFPSYFVLFFNSILGVSQFFRWASGGVGTVHIDFDELRRILVPVPPEDIQKKLDEVYKIVAIKHEEAINATSKDHRQGWLFTAMGLLEVLLYETERLLTNKADQVRPLLPLAPELERQALIEYQALGEYLHESDRGGKAWVEKLFGLRLYRLPNREYLFDTFLQSVQSNKVVRIFTKQLRG